MPQRVFDDWQLVYIEAETRGATRALNISITERDVRQMVNQCLELQSTPLLKNESEILSSKVSRKRLVEFLLDSIVVDDNEGQLKISITHLLSRMLDRKLLLRYFKLTGGRYLPSAIM